MERRLKNALPLSALRARLSSMQRGKIDYKRGGEEEGFRLSCNDVVFLSRLPLLHCFYTICKIRRTSSVIEIDKVPGPH